MDDGQSVDVDLDADPAPHLPTRRLIIAAAITVVCAVVASMVTAARPDETSSIRPDETTPTTIPRMTTTSVPPRVRGDTRVIANQDLPVLDASTSTVPVTTLVTPAVPAPPPPTPPPATAPPAEPAAVVARPIPAAVPKDAPTGPAVFPSRTTPSGHLSTDAGCAAGTSAAALDDFFRSRMGPVIGHDYQHVYALGGDRHLWLFQDTFIDHTGKASRLDQAAFAHNTAMLQEGRCFTLLHRGTATAPLSFETGTGESVLSRWFWPQGGETIDGRLHVVWVEMVKTSDPRPPDGLGWVPARTWLATYDAATLSRQAFRRAPDAGVAPVYGFAVSSDETHTYLFGNTFDQNLERQGGYWACPCSATEMYLARVPRGRLDAAPEYHTASGWSTNPAGAVPVLDRFHAENPMQPRFLGGRWVAATKVDGYWGDELVIDVAAEPAGPWTTAIRRRLAPRGGDPLMNTYHAHLLPWLQDGTLVVSVSQNARDMLRDAWPQPARYRLQFLTAGLPEVPPPSTTTTTTTTSTTTTSTTTTVPETTTTESTTTSTSSTSTTSTTSTSTTSSVVPG